MPCNEKTEVNCCPRLNKHCCPVTISLENGSVVGEVIVTIENGSKGPIVPGLLFSLGVFNGQTTCSVEPECDAKFVGSRMVQTDNGTGYETIFRVRKTIPACGGTITLTISCSGLDAPPQTLVGCIECFCPDLEATVRCKSMVGLCKARAKSSPRGVNCCVPICSEPLQLAPLAIEPLE